MFTLDKRLIYSILGLVFIIADKRRVKDVRSV
jgi:hypothetical protein